MHWQDSLARPVTAPNSARPFAKKLLVAGLYGCLAWSSVMAQTAPAPTNTPQDCQTVYGTTTIGGLIACWPLDSATSHTVADIVGGNTGSISPKGIEDFRTIDGRKAMRFTDNTFIKVPVGTTFDFNTSIGESYTFATWATFDHAKNANPLIVLAGVDGYPRTGLVKRPQSDHQGKFVAIAGNGQRQTVVYSDPPGRPVADQWVHLAGVFDAATDTVKLYMNGELQDTKPLPPNLNFDLTINAGAKDVNLRIGANTSPTTPRRHDGYLDDVRIYNRALSDDEIALIAGNTQPNPSDPCQAAKTQSLANVITSVKSGRWDAANTWSSSRLPGPTDWVIIKKEHVVITPPDDNGVNACEDTSPIKVKGLCVQRGAKLRSAANGFVSLDAQFLNNRGTIVGRDRSWPRGNSICLGDGSTTSWFRNAGTIQSGNALPFTSVSGGKVEIFADDLVNLGGILSGNGADGSCANDIATPAGNGGNILIEPNGFNPGVLDVGAKLKKISNRGLIRSGAGGNFFTNCGARRGTRGFELTAGLGGKITCNGGKCPEGSIEGSIGGKIWIDPIEITFSKDTQITGSEVFIVTDDKGTIQANDLQPGAVSAEKILTLAVGAGGTIDLSKAADKAFKAGEEIRIFTDNLILPEGKTLQDFMDAPKVTQAAGKTIYSATWTGEGAKLAGDPNTSVSLPLTLLNEGPTTGSYTFSIQDTLGWTLCSLPATMTLDSQAKTTLNCAVTLPATTEVDNTITVTATSQNDPTMQAISEITVHVGPVPEETVGDDLELPPPTFTASSVILDGDQQPVMDVTVQIGDQTATTDDSGYWDITELPEGTYPVTVTKDGYTFEYEKEVIIGNGDLTLSIVAHSLLAMKVECPNLIDQGAEISCQYTITNQGSDNTTGIALTLEPSPNITLTSLTGEQVNCSTFAAPYSCTLPDLAPGAVAKVTMVANNSGFETLENKFIETKAMLSSTNYPTETVITEIDVRPHLWIETKCKPNPVPIQGQLQCVVTVHLNEKAAEVAESVEVSLPKTPGVAVQTIQPSAGQCDTEDPRDIICALGNLAQGAESTITLDLQLEDVGLLMFRQQATVSAENYPGDAGSGVAEIFVPEDIKADQVILIDTTSSMQMELDGAIAAYEEILADLPADLKLTIALIEFKDDVRIKAFTQDLQILVTAMEKLTVEGGGLCPEASAEALEIALKHVKDGGTILLATDASPYPEADLTKLGDLLKQKNVKFHALISGDCAMSGGVN